MTFSFNFFITISIILPVLGVTMQMMAESLVLGEKAGLDWSAMIECICDSAAAASALVLAGKGRKKGR